MSIALFDNSAAATAVRRLLLALALSAGVAAPASSETVPIDQMTVAQALDFLRGTIIAQGKVVYHATYSNSESGATWSADFSDSFTNLRLNPVTCNLGYHFTELRDGAVVLDVPDAGVTFSQVDAVTTGSEAARRNKSMAQAGRSHDSVQISPEIWAVTLYRTGSSNHLLFYGRAMADQASDAAARLRALCRPQ